MVKHTSLCGLGQSAPNPVLSTLRYFRDEYLALLRDDAERRRPECEHRWAGPCQAARPVARLVKAVIMAAVKTLTINGKLINAHERPDDPRGRERSGDRDPDPVPPRGRLRRRRLPALPGRGRRPPRLAARLHHAGRRGDEGPDRHRAARGTTGG